MAHHQCPTCEYKTLYKQNLTKHEKRMHTKDKPLLGTPARPWACVCGKTFCYQSGLSRHKHTCPSTNVVGSSASPKVPHPHAEVASQQSVHTFGSASITGNNNSHNTLTNNNITINITPFSKTSPEITQEKLVSLARGGMQEALLKMINEQHFNPEKPEGMNCYISNLKDQIGRIFEEDGWQVIEAKELSSGLFQKYRDCLDQVIDELSEEDLGEMQCRADAGEKKYEKLLRFVKNWERKASLEEFVDGSSRVIHLLLYNKKDLVRKTHDLRR